MGSETYRKHPGTFIELGAYDGRTHSNTRLLEQMGWTGILIEGCDEFAAKCRKMRPKAEVINAVVGNGEQEEFVIGGQYSGVTRTMPEEFIEGHLQRGHKMVYVQTKRIQDLLPRRSWTYFSLDTEGGEYDILKDFFYRGCMCDLLTVEFRYDYSVIHHFDELCGEYGLVLDQVRGFDLCYRRKT